jgi:hypothetical protein
LLVTRDPVENALSDTSSEVVQHITPNWVNNRYNFVRIPE